ncbi:MAG: hypothetical protein JRH16_13350 [Deltaproteobacteria bacterium]|nr:hypothetical protein [Deltaproteobacteria bacterium]MBW2361305.1 hypothetical protein [Deltaproteobacteria bacterium]
MPEPRACTTRRLKRAGASGLVLWLIVGCGPAMLESAPLELVARWVTDAPGYDDRYLEIRSDTLVWGMGRTTLARHAIEEIERVPEGRGRPPAYRFQYSETGGYDDVLVVHLVSASPRRIRLGSRTEEWTPVEE